jgi:hypothetical protein
MTVEDEVELLGCKGLAVGAACTLVLELVPPILSDDLVRNLI